MRLDERVHTHLSTHTRFGDVRLLDEVDSTNRFLVDLAAAGAPEGVVAVAEHQTAGRGRLGRTWEAPAGTCLLVSTLLRPTGLPPDRLHLVTAAVGLSARSACETAAGFQPDLKWPNDLVVGDRKLAGILAEAGGTPAPGAGGTPAPGAGGTPAPGAGGTPAVVVGLGLNVSWAPAGAVSAEEIAGRPVDRAELLTGLLVALEGWLGQWDDVAAAYRTACATVGRRVRVEMSGPSIVGIAESVDAGGRLVVRGDDGAVTAVAAGDVEHLRQE